MLGTCREYTLARVHSPPWFIRCPTYYASRRVRHRANLNKQSTLPTYPRIDYDFVEPAEIKPRVTESWGDPQSILEQDTLVFLRIVRSSQ